MLILAAGRDDRVAIRSVIEYAAKLRLAARDVHIVVARDQPHSTDDPLARRATLYLMKLMFATNLLGPAAANPVPDVRRCLDVNYDDR